MPIETNFRIAFVAELALREKQIQQNYRPVIAVHKWFARRPGTLFRALVLSEFSDKPLPMAFYQAHAFPGRRVCDPFMGGGTPLLEANRVGCDVVGYDINPIAVHVVQEELAHVDVAAYRNVGLRLVDRLAAKIGEFYRTRCAKCGEEADAKYFLWVKTHQCNECGEIFELFPGFLVAQDSRHPLNVVLCHGCSELNEIEDLENPGKCGRCDRRLRLGGNAARRVAECRRCGHENDYPRPERGAPGHKMFAIEYHCATCRPEHKGRFFKAPDEDDHARFERARAAWERTRPCFVPTEEIPEGDETDRLHRWGYRHYRELFNERQLLGLEASCRLLSRVDDARLRTALATNLSDLLRYQNMLCRYDTMALKSLDVFSIHGFPAGLIQCESNMLGITRPNGVNVGSGGWTNIIDKYAKAKEYCDQPFEVVKNGTQKRRVFTSGEWIGETRGNASSDSPRAVRLVCADAREAELEPNSLDAVFTDPPYFGNVQYGELMDFCHVWLRRLVEAPYFRRESARSAQELTGNATQERGIVDFTEGLAAVFRRMASALKPGAPLAFTFHHNDAQAYAAVGVALLDSGLVCSASLPCPAEMGGSIHIHGTASSIVDTVFVCRDSGSVPAEWLVRAKGEIIELVAHDLAELREGGRRATDGDLRCIVCGHLTRMAVWDLRERWDVKAATPRKLDTFAGAFARYGVVKDIALAAKEAEGRIRRPGFLFDRDMAGGEDCRNAVAF